MTRFQNDIRLRIERGAHKHGLTQLEACVQVAGVLTALIEAAPDAELLGEVTNTGQRSELSELYKTRRAAMAG